MTLTRAVEAGARAALTNMEQKALELGPMLGLAPGSNFWPFIEYQADDGTMVGGEIVQALVRNGLMSAYPLAVLVVTDTREQPDMPSDCECTHEIDTTPAGRAALRLKIEEMGRS